MIELNKIHCIDVLEGLKQLEDNSIDVIITSPPYNKQGLNGKQKFTPRYKGDNWSHEIRYNNDVMTDCMNEEDYQKWQIEIIKECYRVLKDNGSLFYNHKNRIHNGKGTIISPLTWLVCTPFKIRQEIIWERQGSPVINTCRYIPTTEKIFWLTKTNKPNFFRHPNVKFKGETWKISQEKGTEHPAPFPIDLPDNILDCIPNDTNNPITVLDPFMGSGTVAVSAIKHNMNWIGFEKFECYVDMGNKRIEEYKETK